MWFPSVSIYDKLCEFVYTVTGEDYSNRLVSFCLGLLSGFFQLCIDIVQVVFLAKINVLGVELYLGGILFGFGFTALVTVWIAAKIIDVIL